MISDLFQRTLVADCDDDGVYYIRQLEATEGAAGFDCIVWFGQQFEHEPTFANVFIGRLRLGVRTDARGQRVDVWDGSFFDVPKGTTCGRGALNLDSLTVDAADLGGGCDFPESYLRRTSRSGFGGLTWPLPVSYCWDVAFRAGRLPAPPAIPPRVAAARSPFGVIESAVAALGSAPVAAGFERSGDNVTGSWRGDDGGSYYLTEVTTGLFWPFRRRDVVWYAEHPTARPAITTAGGATPSPAAGWANVFVGTRSRSRIGGFWADVPRGATRGAGRLELNVETPNHIRVTSATGGYGGRQLWRVRTRDVTVRVTSLTVERGEEGADEPQLYLEFFKIDGDTVDLDSLATSTVTVQIQPELRLGTDVRGTVAVPEAQGSWRTTLSTVRSVSGAGIDDATRIGVIAYAIEVDDGYSAEFRQRRYDSWTEGRQFSLNNRLHAEIIPDVDFIRTDANEILVRYLGPWEGWPWGDPDDTLSGDAQLVTFADLVARPRIERTLTFAGEGASYTASVVFEAHSRLSPSCSS